MAIISTLGGENRVIVGTDRFARQPSFMLSNTWQKLRIGMRLCMSDSGSDALNCNFRVGICSGNTLIYGDSGAAPKHFYGINPVGNFNVFPRATVPTRYAPLFTGGNILVNGVTTASAPDMEPSAWNVGATDSNRTLLFVDFTKGQSNWTLNYFRNTNSSCTDIDVATFNAAVLVELPSVTDHSFATAWVSPVPNEASNGYFDHINISWNHASPTFKISDITVVKFL